MTGKLPIVPVDQPRSERRSIKVEIFGKSCTGKTSQLPTLPPDMTLFFDVEDGSPEPEVRS